MDGDWFLIWLVLMGAALGSAVVIYVQCYYASSPYQIPSPGTWLAGYRSGQRDARHATMAAVRPVTLTPAQCTEIAGLCRCGYTPAEIRAMAKILDSDPDLIEAEAERWAKR
jgi:hypothetical protein